MRSLSPVRIQPYSRIFARSALLVAVSFLFSTTLRAQLRSEGNLTVAEQYLLAAANHERVALGLPTLRLDPALSQASALHAQQMAEHEDISHQFSDEPGLEERGANAGVRFSLIAENVGEAPTSVIIHNLWMNSPGHRANLLDPSVDSIGIAVVVRDSQLYAVEDFASTVQALSLNQQETTVAKVIEQSGMLAVDATMDARQTCAMPTGYAGSRQPRYIMRYTASTLSELPTQLKARLTSGKYRQAVVGACSDRRNGSFTAYNIAVLLYP
ncbi:MAG: CAP domain-containing protein [Edaphobacter sp.]